MALRELLEEALRAPAALPAAAEGEEQVEGKVGFLILPLSQSEELSTSARRGKILCR